MVKVISTIKAVLTRIIFSAHSLVAVWQVYRNTGNPIYWTLCAPILLLALEGVFTLAIKKNQEWRWFCPSVFLYLGSVVPAIWLLELDKVDKRVSVGNKLLSLSNQTALQASDINQLLGNQFKIPEIKVDLQTLTTLIEQFLMLILIVGRWMLPKGDLTRDQLSQLLLVYIGTAADIIEFFDSYKDDMIAKEPLLVFLTLGIWSWSLLQFTIVLSATRARKPRGGGSSSQEESTDCCNDCCCGIDVWGIALNVVLQDAPFLTFRLLIIVHYRIINYMNVFFTCKNSLVIVLQLYRLYVVNAEYWKAKRELKRSKQRGGPIKKRKRIDEDIEKSQEIYIISEKQDKKKVKRAKEDSDEDTSRRSRSKKDKHKKRIRKDTGYSTASSQNMGSSRKRDDKPKQRKKDKKTRKRSSSSESESDYEVKKRKHKSDEKKKSKKNKHFDAVMEESDTTESSIRYEVVNEKHSKKKKKKRRKPSTDSSSSSSSSSSS